MKLRRRWYHSARTIDRFVNPICCFIGSFVGTHYYGVNPYLCALGWGMVAGYSVSSIVSMLIWGTCPLMVANDMIFLGKTNYDKSRIYQWTNKTLGKKWIAPVAITQAVAVGAMVALMLVTIVAVVKH